MLSDLSADLSVVAFLSSVTAAKEEAETEASAKAEAKHLSFPPVRPFAPLRVTVLR